MTSITPLALPDVLLITPRRHGDARGWCAETWSRRAFEAAGLDLDFVQDNQSFNAEAGTVRGLHFQTAPHPQTKLVRCLRGARRAPAGTAAAARAAKRPCCLRPRWISSSMPA